MHFHLKKYVFEYALRKCWPFVRDLNVLTHWGRVTHLCVSNLTIIGSDNGLSPGRRQAIIWTNAEILLIGALGTNFNEILIEIHTFSFKKMHLKMSFGKWRLICLCLNVLNGSSSCTYESLPGPPAKLNSPLIQIIVLRIICEYLLLTAHEMVLDEVERIIANITKARYNTVVTTRYSR